MKQLLHLCGHVYQVDCMRRPPKIEQVKASVCPMCATHVLYSIVAQENVADTRFDVLFLPPRARIMRRLALAAHDPGEASREFQIRYPHAVYLAPDALDNVAVSRQPKATSVK